MKLRHQVRQSWKVRYASWNLRGPDAVYAESSQQEERRDPWLAEGSCRLQVGQTTLDYKALLQGKRDGEKKEL